MNADYRNALLGILSRFDQHVADAEWTLSKTRDAEVGAMAEDLRELQVGMQAKVEEKLDRLIES